MNLELSSTDGPLIFFKQEIRAFIIHFYYFNEIMEKEEETNIFRHFMILTKLSRCIGSFPSTYKSITLLSFFFFFNPHLIFSLPRGINHRSVSVTPLSIGFWLGLANRRMGHTI